MPSLASLGVEEAEESTSWFPSLSWQDRVYGFFLCVGLGFLCSMLAWASFYLGHIVRYSILLSIGNLVSLLSTGFLVGFQKQAQTMFHEKRRVTSSVYLLSMIGTIVVAVLTHKVLLAVLLCIIQYCALIWYGLSYIPYGRDIALKIMKGCDCCPGTISI
ncbi:putative vesicle transport protein SFT2B-like [Diplonema papillatum]|nr:putative vesicle transport protein SFT2B-like [Diplonema papillatum]